MHTSLLLACYGLVITTVPHPSLGARTQRTRCAHRRTQFQNLPHRCNYGLRRRWKLNNSVGGAPGFLGAFGASCGSNGVRSVRQWCAVREQVRAQVRVQVRAGAASFVQCGGHGVRAVRL